MLADSDNRLEKQESNERKPKRSLALDRIKEEKMIELRCKKKEKNRRGKIGSAR